MKDKMTPLALALALCGFACAAWIHAASTSLFSPEYPAPATVATVSVSAPEVRARVESQREAVAKALAEIKVAGESPESLRSAFTNYWNERLNLDLSDLQPRERDEIESSLKVAHLTRINQLAEDLKSEPMSWELQFVARELIRGAKATAE
jgi:hypothetical protein